MLWIKYQKKNSSLYTKMLKNVFPVQKLNSDNVQMFIPRGYSFRYPFFLSNKAGIYMHLYGLKLRSKLF